MSFNFVAAVTIYSNFGVILLMSRNHLSVCHFFLFVSRMLYKWNHPAYNFSSSIILWRFIHVVTCINSWLFFHAEYLFHDMYVPDCLTIHTMTDIQAVSNPWLSWVKLLWTFVYRYLWICFYFFSFLSIWHLSGIDVQVCSCWIIW